MSIKLRTDFYDYYDHWFCATGQKYEFLFDRPTRAKSSRLEDFELLKAAGLKVVKHSNVELLHASSVETLGEDVTSLMMVVVYTDEYAHAGEGKILLPLDEALALYPKNLASEYIPASMREAVSYRYLRVGKRQFWLRYTSTDDWRSNAGNGFVEYLCEEKEADSYLLNPIFAVDFLRTGKMFVAIDYNPSPKISGTGIERVMPPKEAYRQIQQAIIHFAGCERIKTPYLTRVQ